MISEIQLLVYCMFYALLTILIYMVLFLLFMHYYSYSIIEQNKI